MACWDESAAHFGTWSTKASPHETRSRPNYASTKDIAEGFEVLNQNPEGDRISKPIRESNKAKAWLKRAMIKTPYKRIMGIL